MNIQNQPQGSRERPLDEVKAEFMKRAGKLNPFEDIKREDAEAVMAALKNLDKDHWAEEWSKIGLGYETKGDAAAKSGTSGKALAEIYMHGFDACRVGRYPSPVSPGKWQAFQHSLRIFRKASKHFDPPLEIVEIPFAGKTLTGYLQKPAGVSNPKVVMHWGGVDGWKEDRLRIANHIMKAGLASFTIDMPGSGENPLLYVDPAAEKTFLTWLDYLPTRSDIDGKSVAVWGGSFGAYWAARLAFTATDRIKGAVFQGGNIHYGFQPEWLVPAFTTGGATYLFGAQSLLDARGRAVGASTIDDFLKAVAPLSLKTMGLLDKKSAPLLGVNGKLDDQAPIADVYLLLEHGNAKSARVYPDGHHMGRTPGQPAEHITVTIVEWLTEQLGRR
jgi:dienelactone hydrolase